ncbi:MULTISPECIES: hypothetical protein [Nostocales]|uniref:Uncharacterized protein n=1 Tax=Dolichospermum flos-aquae UHCC 0037 TaxID=2590026 RepID=A0ACC7SAP9_DOLFA|nr:MULTISPECIES: hypothetical protein [Nostocales]MBO1063274.1 hypothetical protein [Anabaena sp. 54]MTJ45598.1 hypothetical protein [Dolichospermum flos-aquae UHCC 0037]
MIYTNNFFFEKDKQQLLVNFLLRGNVIGEKHHLILVSCYFNLKSANAIIKALQEKINLYKISIYIDRGEAICIGLDEINNWIKNTHFHNIEISFKVNNSSSLFHAKAYCLFSDTSKKGSLVLGSANLTGRGLTENNGNIEILYNTQDENDIENFCSDLKILDNKFMDVSEINTFVADDDYYFKYALIQLGCFVERNDITINAVLQHTYNFNEKGKKESKTDEYKQKDFIEQGGASKNYFQGINEDIENIFLQYNNSYKIDWGKYGIKTKFGHWIPKKILRYLDQIPKEKQKIKECQFIISSHIKIYFITSVQYMVDQWRELLIDDRWVNNDTGIPLKEKNYDNITKILKQETEKILRQKMKNFVSDSCLEKLLLRYQTFNISFDFANQEDINKFFKDLKFNCIKRINTDNIDKNIYQIKEDIKNINAENQGDQILEILRKYKIDINTNILNYCLYLSMECRNLIFLTCLNTDNFIKIQDDLDQKNQ